MALSPAQQKKINAAYTAAGSNEKAKRAVPKKVTAPSFPDLLTKWDTFVSDLSGEDGPAKTKARQELRKIGPADTAMVAVLAGELPGRDEARAKHRLVAAKILGRVADVGGIDALHDVVVDSAVEDGGTLTPTDIDLGLQFAATKALAQIEAANA